MNALVLNSGSTSLKFCLFDTGDDPIVSGEIDWAHGERAKARAVVRPRGMAATHSVVSVPDEAAATRCALSAVREAGGRPQGTGAIELVGHRVVHGGADLQEAAVIDDGVKRVIAKFGPLAPLHNPPALSVIEAAQALLPGVPQVAVFDTAFYRTLPPRAFVYPLPYEWHAEWGIRRYGFHGLSHAYCAERAAELLGGRFGAPRLVSCHLGGGCSATAVREGKAIATTMGFSPLEGLMMGTRPGSVDPGLLLYLLRERGLTPAQLDRALNHASGLLGVSGLSPDLARIEAAADQGNDRARLAFDLFADRVRSAIASLAAAMGGLDAVVFTDRIGESSSRLRAAVCEDLGFMGLRLDPKENLAGVPDSDVADADSRVRVLIIHTREELLVARKARRAVSEWKGA